MSEFEIENQNHSHLQGMMDSAGLYGKLGVGVLCGTCQKWLEMSRTMPLPLRV